MPRWKNFNPLPSLLLIVAGYKTESYPFFLLLFSSKTVSGLLVLYLLYVNELSFNRDTRPLLCPFIRNSSVSFIEELLYAIIMCIRYPYVWYICESSLLIVNEEDSLICASNQCSIHSRKIVRILETCFCQENLDLVSSSFMKKKKKFYHNNLKQSIKKGKTLI